MTKDGAEVKVTTSENFREHIQKMIILKIYNIKKRIEKATQRGVEKALQLVWGDINFLTRGRRHGTIEVRRT